MSNINKEKINTQEAAKQSKGISKTITNPATLTNPIKNYSDTSQLLPSDIKPLENITPDNSPSIDIHNEIKKVADLYITHCSMRPEEVDAIALWCLSTYLINSFRIFPKLAFISPQKRCGKSTCMEITDSIVRDSMLTSNLSPAVMYRIGAIHQPTLLIDEADTYVKNGDRELIGIINSGHTKASAYAYRCSGEDHTPTKFSTWMPMGLASIGTLPETIMDRSIVINLRRKKASDSITKLHSGMKDTNLPMREKLARWSLDNQSNVKNSIVEPPYTGNDRAVDNWTPLYKIAEIIGGDWPSRCEEAYIKLTEPLEEELPTQLLTDIRGIFDNHPEDKISSNELVNKLIEDETRPWKVFEGGKPITANKVARILNPYKIRPKTIRLNNKTPKGYEKHQFTDAFERYLSPSI